ANLCLSHRTYLLLGRSTDWSFSLKSSQPLERRQGGWAGSIMLWGIWADCPASLGYPGGDCSFIYFDLMDIPQCLQSKADILLSQCHTLFWGCISVDRSLIHGHQLKLSL
ncbi:unnamed protein product, partial [Staurois parvus]